MELELKHRFSRFAHKSNYLDHPIRLWFTHLSLYKLTLTIE